MKRLTLNHRFGIVWVLMMFVSLTVSTASATHFEACTEWITYTYSAANFSLESPTPAQDGLTLFDPASGTRQHWLQAYRLGFNVRWSSTASHLLFEGAPQAVSAANGEERLYLYDVATERITEVTQSRVDGFAWSSSGAYFSVQLGLELSVYAADGSPLIAYSGTTGAWLPNDHLYLNNHYAETLQDAVIVDFPELSETVFEFSAWHPNTTLAGAFGFAPSALWVSPDEHLMLLTHRQSDLPQPLFYDRAMPYTDGDALPQTETYPPLLVAAERLDAPLGWANAPALLAALTHPYFYLSSNDRYFIALTDKLYHDAGFFEQAQADLQTAMLEAGTIPFFGRGGRITAIAPSPDGSQYQFTAQWYGETRYLLVTLNPPERLYFAFETASVYPIIIDDTSFAAVPHVVWSPDGTRMATVSGGDVVLYGGTSSRNLTAALRANGTLTLPEFAQILRVVGWSARQDRLLFLTGDLDATLPMSLYTLRPDGSDLGLVMDGTGSTTESPFIKSVSWSPCLAPSRSTK